jgi:hypothetical protein
MLAQYDNKPFDCALTSVTFTSSAAVGDAPEPANSAFAQQTSTGVEETPDRH